MTLDELEQYIRFMDAHGLVELELEQEGRRVRLRKGAQGEPVVTPVVAPAAPAAAAAPPAAEAETAPVANGSLIEVVSPMVGTFYRAATPDAEPFADAGDPVGPDTVICIVEAMKVMNEVPAGCAGTIQEVCVENGQPVEFGQVLFRVQP